MSLDMNLDCFDLLFKIKQKTKFNVPSIQTIPKFEMSKTSKTLKKLQRGV